MTPSLENNIQLNYRYRDGGNYKQHHSEIFSNKDQLDVQEISERIEQRLIDGEYFYHNKWGLKDLHYFKWDNDIDVFWHEFVSIETTSDKATNIDISDFLAQIETIENSII